MNSELASTLRRVLVGLTLLAALVAAPLPDIAGAVTNTSYVTANLAGANSTYGPSEAVRITNLVTVKNNVAFLAPHGVAAQELCLSDRGLWDSGNELIQAWQTNGTYKALVVTTGKTVSNLHCVQANGVFAHGINPTGHLYNLPYDNVENRMLICLQTSGFVLTTTCSTHLSKVSQAWATTQSDYARQVFDFLSTVSSSYGSWLGGDFNSTPFNAPLGFYQTPHSESDRFLSRATANAGKIDFGFGLLPLTISQSGAVLAGRGVTSDHHLLWAPFTWG